MYISSRTTKTQLHSPTQKPSPITIAQWCAPAEFDANWSSELLALRARMLASAKPILLHLISEAALEAAIALTQQRRTQLEPALITRGLPLLGVPFLVKDNIDVAGMPTTAACSAFAYSPKVSAAAVQRLQAAGAICMGKTNLDQFATGLVGTRSPFGAPSCVFDDAYISGGSSSGSAVAVASGWVPFSLGTDTAGSGRIPAMFNHVVGLKPTPGRVPTKGVVPACASLDCVSIFALTVQDATTVLSVIEGPQEGDSFSNFKTGSAHFPAALRIGSPSNIPGIVNEKIAMSFDQCCKDLSEQQGHAFRAIDFDPLYQVANLLYNGPWVAERLLVVQQLLAQCPEALDPAVRKVIARANDFSAADTFKAQYELGELRLKADKIWQEVDCLVVPTAPYHPTHEEVAADPVGVNAGLGQFTNFVNLLGWSALSIPVQRTQGELPFGLTLIGPSAGDLALANLAQRWQIEFAQKPGLVDLPNHFLSEPPIATPRFKPRQNVAVVGAHLSGLPLNWQLTQRHGQLVRSTQTSANYQLFALPNTSPPKPGLQRVQQGGHAIAVEIWSLPVEHLGSFLALIPAPLGLGSIELEDGSQCHGFLCESYALENAIDISHFGGWRTYLSSLKTVHKGVLDGSS